MWMVLVFAMLAIRLVQHAVEVDQDPVSLATLQKISLVECVTLAPLLNIGVELLVLIVMHRVRRARDPPP